jgi:hypothetical protein
MEQRIKAGKEKYGTLLETWNGRNPIQDALEEWFDKGTYLTQAARERVDMLALLREYYYTCVCSVKIPLWRRLLKPQDRFCPQCLKYRKMVENGTRLE